MNTQAYNRPAKRPKRMGVSHEPFEDEADGPSDERGADVPSAPFGEKLTPFSAEGKEQVTVAWDNLSFTIGQGKKRKGVLHNVSGTAKPGDLVAILGPSGAGKSTLLNVLAVRAPYGKAAGSIDVNGLPPKKMRKKIAYVMQENALFATQTPRETFAFTAALKLPELSDAERSELVESVLTALGLQTCADTMVGSLMIKGISGGEKKRTSIGVELISSPSVIFLDEPTSGLDSHSAFEVVKHLRALANSGSTIVCSIHQPSSEVFDLFNKVLLLRNGCSLYYGPADGLVPHFATVSALCKPNYNPADFAMHQIQTMSEDKIERLKKPENNGKAAGVCETGLEDDLYDGTAFTRKASFWLQVTRLVKRETLQFFRDKVTLGARYGMALILALFTGMFFYSTGSEWGDLAYPDDVSSSVGNHWGALAFVSIIAMFLTAQPTILVFPTERPVFMREYATGTYGTLPYMLSKTLVELPASLLQTLIQLVVSYFMVDLNGNFFYLLMSTFALGFVTSSIALCIGAATTRAETAVNLMPAIYIPQILASGFFVATQSIPPGVRWTQWLCPLKYGLALCTISEFSSSYVPDDRVHVTSFTLENSDIDPDDWWIYVVVLVSMFVFFRATAAFILTKRARSFS
ncbi:ABC transporter G family member 7 [Diplonema papillatum]|nr:ABC transporter G family member 7 [Diplonema papillatum]